MSGATSFVKVGAEGGCAAYATCAQAAAIRRPVTSERAPDTRTGRTPIGLERCGNAASKARASAVARPQTVTDLPLDVEADANEARLEHLGRLQVRRREVVLGTD